MSTPLLCLGAHSRKSDGAIGVPLSAIVLRLPLEARKTPSEARPPAIAGQRRLFRIVQGWEGMLGEFR